jgi:hypothetical protein
VIIEEIRLLFFIIDDNNKKVKAIAIIQGTIIDD